MAEKRMFTGKITDSDAFLEMPLSAQALYFHLNMNADDDGFVNNPKKIQRSVRASEDDLKLLIVKRFIIGFESGIIVIKHWRMHNTLRKDRYNPTQYQEEFATLALKEGRIYTEKKDGNQLATNWQPNGNQLATQYSVVECSVVEDREEEYIEPPAAAPDSPKPTKHKYGEYGWVKLTDEEYNRLLTDLGQGGLDRCIRYVDESAQGNKNKNKWSDWNLVIRRCHREAWGVRQQRGGGFQTNNPFAEMLAEERGK